MEQQTIWWLKRTIQALPKVPQLAFVHVPVPEFMELWNKGLARGSKHETVNCPMHDSGLFQAAKDMGITAIYSGHDHDNNYEGVLEGVRLAYGHKTGEFILPKSKAKIQDINNETPPPGIACRELNMHESGLFEAAQMSITAICCGHDHNNDYEGVLEGVRLAYGHKTGEHLPRYLPKERCHTHKSTPSIRLGSLSWPSNMCRSLVAKRLPDISCPDPKDRHG